MTYCGDQILYDCQECITDNEGNPKIVSYNSRHDCSRCLGNNNITPISLPCQSCTETYGAGDAWKKKNPESPLSSCHKCKVRSNQEYWVGCPDNSECINGDCKPICNPPCPECESCECVNPKCSKTICKQSCDPKVNCFGSKACNHITFNTIPSENNDLIMFDADVSPDFDGELGTLILTFYSPLIHPSDNPVLLHLRYDEESEEVFYDNITSEVKEGSISGIVTSLSPFVVSIKTNTISVGDNNGKFDPCLVVSGCSAPGSNCGFNLGYTPPGPCPGNTTRGHWVIQNGVPTPRLLATICDCYVPSAITVDMVLAVAGAVGLAKALICSSAKSIATLGIPATISLISRYKTSIAKASLTISSLSLELSIVRVKLAKAIAETSEILSKIDELRIKMGQQLQRLENLVEEFLGRSVRPPSGPGYLDDWNYFVKRMEEFRKKPSLDKKGFFKRYNQVINSDSGSNLLDKLTYQRNKLYNTQGSLSAKAMHLEEKIAENEGVIGYYTEELAKQAGILAAKEGQKASLMSTIAQATKDAFASTLAMYVAADEISIKKTCASNEVLDPFSCECCPKCTGGKVFPNPMRGCNCTCPPGKEPCFKVGDDGCYDPCPPGKIRTSAECQCYNIPGIQSINLLP